MGHLRSGAVAHRSAVHSRCVQIEGIRDRISTGGGCPGSLYGLHRCLRWSTTIHRDCQWPAIPLRRNATPPATEPPWPLSPKEVGSTMRHYELMLILDPDLE